MDCAEAMRIVKKWSALFVRGEKTKVSVVSIEKAFKHIRECREEKCHDLWLEFNNLITRKFEDKKIEAKDFYQKEEK